MSRKILLLILALAAGCSRGPAYLDSSLSARKRADDLLSRMTLEEKRGQLLCPYGWPMYVKTSDSTAAVSGEYVEFVRERHGGMLWALFRADPWTQKTLETGLDPVAAVSAYNALQHYAVDSTRLGIPILLAEEAPHGHMAIGKTVFPTGLGLSATWDTALMEEVGSAISGELRASGASIALGPIADISRDPRWSRVEETFGEDGFLTACMVSAIVRGSSPQQIGWDRGVVTVLKHFIAYGTPMGGHNGAPSVASEQELEEVFLPPFKAAVEAGALGVMTSYNSLNGIPSTASPLINNTLRDKWGFGGIVISDLYSIDGLRSSHRMAHDNAEAARMALEAGVDVDLGANCYPLLEEGRALDDAVRRVLELKFRLGLFEHPYAVGEDCCRSREHRDVALRAAREGVVLLDNNGVLPLSKASRVAVIGPNADMMYNQLGDYTAPQAEDAICTPLEGICGKIGNANVRYARGCAIRDVAHNDIPAAVAAARWADVAVVFVGGSSARDFETKYQDTGAAVASGAVSDMECGEGFDRSSLSLMGDQQRLLEAVKATGTPLVVVYIEGRPLDKLWASANADALLTQFYPGEAGGQAIADVLFGDVNPSGRLPLSVPRGVGQIPVYYNHIFPYPGDYVEMPAAPLYSFGHGLSYTTFSYDAIECEALEAGRARVRVRITNTGSREGDEVVQLYAIATEGPSVGPCLQLKGFSRVHLLPGESAEAIMVVDLPRGCRNVELKAGPSSDRLYLSFNMQACFLEPEVG